MAILFATATSGGLPIAFSLVRGTRWDDDFQLKDSAGTAIDLTGITGLVMRIRSSISSTTVLLELSVANTRLVVTNALTGSVGIRVDSADTQLFPANGFKRARYVYDAVIERTTGEYEPAISGKVTVLPQVTRQLDDA